MKLIDKSITKDEVGILAQRGFGNLVKTVIDVTKEIMVIDASFHADEEAYLLSLGSRQQDLWGINIYPELTGEDFIEFDSMINLRPGQGNMTRSVDDKKIQSKLREIVHKLIL